MEISRCSLRDIYGCMNTGVFYFNIEGSFDDASNIYLVVFANDWENRKNTFLILKNNEWINEFPSKNKLIFPKHYCTFIDFACDFMVICLFIFQCVSVKIHENGKNNTHNPSQTN